MKKVELKIFRLKNYDEINFIAANTNIEALQTYFNETSTDIGDLEADADITEIERSEWTTLTMINTEYDETDASDKEEFTFEEWMKDVTGSTIICGSYFD